LSVLPAAATGSPPVPSDTLATPAQVRTRVRSFLDASGLNGAVVPDSDILVDQAYTPVAGSTIYSRVTVRVPYQVLSISMFNVLPQLKLQGQAMMRNETNLQ
ncbi:MAG TPA: hypothetical protein VNO24_30355, partial [Blastocatellia bacterium]|nr:hypothetical protein [Blastocatellia bacterium]